MAKGNVDRLPHWARDELARLERHVAYLEAERAAGPEDSDTFRWNGGIGEALDTPLGKGASIRFRTGPRWDDRIDARLKLHGDQLVLDITTTGGSTLVHPSSSNHIYVTTEKR